MVKKITEQDRERILFSAGFGREIEKILFGNISDPNSEGLITQVISDYKAAKLPPMTPEWIGKGAPAEAKAWVIEYLSKYFIFKDAPPKWLGEPSWIFIGGYPMTFSHQITGNSSLINNGRKVTYFFKSNKNNRVGEINRACTQEEDSNGIVITFPEEIN